MANQLILEANEIREKIKYYNEIFEPINIYWKNREYEKCRIIIDEKFRTKEDFEFIRKYSGLVEHYIILNDPKCCTENIIKYHDLNDIYNYIKKLVECNHKYSEYLCLYFKLQKSNALYFSQFNNYTIDRYIKWNCFHIKTYITGYNLSKLILLENIMHCFEKEQLSTIKDNLYKFKFNIYEEEKLYFPFINSYKNKNLSVEIKSLISKILDDIEIKMTIIEKVLD